MKILTGRHTGAAGPVPLSANLLALLCAVSFCSCMTFQPQHRRHIEFPISATHDQFQAATRNAAERMGGSIIELSIFTPRSADIVDTSRREQSSIYIGFMAPTSGLVLDSLSLESNGSDTGIVMIKSFYPLITGKAIQEELDYPRPMTSVAERYAAPTAMSFKTRWVFDPLTILSPALANTYLLTGNPFAGESPELTSILVPLAIDAGTIFFYLTERSGSKAGFIALGLAAIYMRLSGIFSLSAEIDRYNTVARSGYNLDFNDIRFFRSQLTLNIGLP